jgi:hypothetical protein
MEKKQTAVEWLAERCGLQALEDVIAEAKQMEKEQIVDAYTTNSVIRGRNKAKQYYNETYGGQDEK